MEKEAVKRFHPDIIDKVRELHGAGAEPEHPIYFYEERKMTGKPGPSGDPAHCRNCDKPFDKGDKAIFFHHAPNEDESWRRDKGFVHLDCQTSKKDWMACPWCKENIESKDFGSHKRSCQGRQQRGYMPAVAKVGHCGYCDEDRADTTKEHIKSDSKDFDELISDIEDMRDEDKEAQSDLDQDTSADDIIEHIESDGDEFEDLKKKIDDMKAEDAEFVEQLKKHAIPNSGVNTEADTDVPFSNPRSDEQETDPTVEMNRRKRIRNLQDKVEDKVDGLGSGAEQRVDKMFQETSSWKKTKMNGIPWGSVRAALVNRD